MVEIVARKAKAEGVAEVLLRVVRRKFRRIPKWREAQVRSATLEQLEDWADRVLDAADIDSLFGENGRAKRHPQG